MFADPKLTPRRSAHEVIDSEHVIQCVLKAAHAWHCGHTGNDTTYGIEICGQANQTRDQWLDEISIKTLSLAAARVGILAKVFGLPIVMLTADDIKAGRTGITSHAEMSKAWHESTHTDPGPGFPWDLFLTACKGATA
jgi:N-acetyl-anhydromuramyl-L-alanine amidase AmpD